MVVNWRIVYHNRYPHLADAFAKVLATGGISKHGTSEASPGMYFSIYWGKGLSLADEEDSKFQLSYFAGPVKQDVRVCDHTIGTHETEEVKRSDYLSHMAHNFKTTIELGKVVFVTEKGYMGILPSITMPGDDVCVYCMAERRRLSYRK